MTETKLKCQLARETNRCGRGLGKAQEPAECWVDWPAGTLGSRRDIRAFPLRLYMSLHGVKNQHMLTNPRGKRTLISQPSVFQQGTKAALPAWFTPWTLHSDQEKRKKQRSVSYNPYNQCSSRSLVITRDGGGESSRKPSGFIQTQGVWQDELVAGVSE